MKSCSSIEIAHPMDTMDMMEQEDRARWQRLLELLRPVHDRALGTARCLARSGPDGDDLFQEAVLRAFRKLPALRDEARFAGWFYAVLVSVHRSRSRRAACRRFLSLEREMAGGWDAPGEDGAERADEHGRAERASRALARLPAVQREAVVLYELEGFSVEEIATMQQVSPSAVKSRLARGRARLRRHYERLGFGGPRLAAPDRVSPLTAPGARAKDSRP